MCLYWIPAISALAYLLLCVNVPLALFPAAGHDDGLFLQRASDIATGHWLGHYDQMTLAKGPGYPLFLAAASLFRVNVTIAHALLACLSVWLLSFATSRVFKSSLLSLLVFEILLWNFGPDKLRILREQIYTSQLLLVFALLLLSFFALRARGRLLCAAFAGLIFGWFWITREEGSLVVPSLAILILFACLPDFRRLKFFAPSFRSAVVFLLASCFLPFVICSVNDVKYGTFSVVDVTGRFERALEAIESAQPDVYVPYLPASANVRAKLYRVSPAFAELRPLLDRPDSPVSHWAQAGCGFYSSTCGDYAGAWFMWALRDAAAFAGKYKTAGSASAYYTQIAAQIKAACRSRALSCYYNPLPFMPHVSPQQLSLLGPDLKTSLRTVAFLNPPLAAAPDSLGTEEQVRDAAVFLNVENHTPPPAPLPGTINPKLIRDAVRFKASVIRIYSRFLAPLLVLGFAAFLYCVVRAIRTRVVSLGLIIAASAWLLVCLRILAVTLLAISSFPALTHEYLSYAFALSCYASLVSIFAVFRKTGQLRAADEDAF